MIAAIVIIVDLDLPPILLWGIVVSGALSVLGLTWMVIDR